jgi:hypothetical protein
MSLIPFYFLNRLPHNSPTFFELRRREHLRFGVQNRDLEFLGDNRGFKEAGWPRFFPFIGESIQEGKFLVG